MIVEWILLSVLNVIKNLLAKITLLLIPTAKKTNNSPQS